MREKPARGDIDATRDCSGPSEAQPLTPETVYRSRRSILDKEAAWRLGEDGLERIEEGRPALLIPYAEIVEFRLSYDPTRFEPTRYRCDVSSRRNGQARIVSVSYVSPANFANRGATYVPFVRAFAASVAKANPACRFVAGKAPMVYVAEQLFLLAMLLLLVSVLYLTGAPIVGIVAIKLALIAVYVPVMISYVRKNRPRRFDPNDIPADVLPSA